MPKESEGPTGRGLPVLHWVDVVFSPTRLQWSLGLNIPPQAGPECFAHPPGKQSLTQ
jgi:hypothetical protein